MTILPRPRSWAILLRFRLRTLLLLVAVAGVLFGSVGREVHHGLRQKAVIDEVQRDGGVAMLSARKGIIAGLLQRFWGDAYGSEVHGVFWGPRPEEDLELLGAFPQLTQLSLTGETVTETALATLADFPNLSELTLINVSINDQKTEVLAQLSNIRRLTFQNCPGVTPDGLLELREASPALDVTVRPDQRFPPIQNLPLTTGFMLRGPLVTDEVLLATLELTRALSTLQLVECDVTDEGLEGLRNQRELTLLYVFGKKPPDESTSGSGLSNVPDIVSGSQITDRSLEHIGQLSKLEQLIMHRCQITDQGLRPIGRLTKLKLLDLQGADITGTGLRNLQALHDLRMLELDDTSLTDTGLRELKGLEKLHYVSFNNTQVTDRGLAEIAMFPSLTNLHLSGTRITDAGTAQLAKMKSLRSLDVSDTQLTDRCIDDLCKLSLEKLYIGRNQFTSSGAERLKRRFGESAVLSRAPGSKPTER